MYSIRYYLSERFRLRFEDSGLDELMDDEENGSAVEGNKVHSDEGIDMETTPPPDSVDLERLVEGGVVRTLDGEIAGDEFAQDALNYQILLGKIDRLLEELKLDA